MAVELKRAVTFWSLTVKYMGLESWAKVIVEVQRVEEEVLLGFIGESRTLASMEETEQGTSSLDSVRLERGAPVVAQA